ncbi:MAG: hypothetical protein AMXMBFR84_41690 [Candidatus Hydrogenedentota bacterium]
MSGIGYSKVLLIAIFVFVIAIEGVVQAAIELSQGKTPTVMELVNRVPTADNLRSFESRMETQSWSARWLRPMTQQLRFELGNDLGAKAVRGQEDWLYYRQDIDFLVQPWQMSASGDETALTTIAAFRDALAARSIHLLVVIAPGKPSIYPEYLSRRSIDEGDDVFRHASDFMQSLDELQIDHVDLFRAWGGKDKGSAPFDLYLARDTHWSPVGAREAARLVAERIFSEGWIDEGNIVFEERRASVQREGDILDMIDVPGIAAKFSPEQMECAQVFESSSQQPYIDDPDSQVLVLGDSFLRIYQRDEPGSAGFIAHLARELKQPLTSIVSDGGASTLVRQELARKPDLLKHKRLVVWEFVERDLRFGMEGWKHVALPE